MAAFPFIVFLKICSLSSSSSPILSHSFRSVPGKKIVVKVDVMNDSVRYFEAIVASHVAQADLGTPVFLPPALSAGIIRRSSVRGFEHQTRGFIMLGKHSTS